MKFNEKIKTTANSSHLLFGHCSRKQNLSLRNNFSTFGGIEVIKSQTSGSFNPF